MMVYCDPGMGWNGYRFEFEMLELSTLSKFFVQFFLQELHDEEYGEWLTKEEKFHLDNAKAAFLQPADDLDA